jgi:hypothetical protein
LVNFKLYLIVTLYEFKILDEIQQFKKR